MTRGWSFDARGKFGYAGGFGRISFGYNRFGFYHWLCGIYQKKYFYGKPHISRMRFYRPTNPQSLTQQNWRAVCAYGVVLWQGYSDPQKLFYNRLAKNLRMSGYNVHLTRWLGRPNFGFGKTTFSYNGFGK